LLKLSSQHVQKRISERRRSNGLGMTIPLVRCFAGINPGSGDKRRVVRRYSRSRLAQPVQATWCAMMQASVFLQPSKPQHHLSLQQTSRQHGRTIIHPSTGCAQYGNGELIFWDLVYDGGTNPFNRSWALLRAVAVRLHALQYVVCVGSVVTGSSASKLNVKEDPGLPLLVLPPVLPMPSSSSSTPSWHGLCSHHGLSTSCST
jgi:hypothetical protein